MELIGRENLSISVVERYDCFRTEIWIFEFKGTEMFNINIGANGELVKNKFEDELRYPHQYGAFLSLPKPFAEVLFKEIQKTLSNRGIKTKDQNLIEGKLQATESHLQDMREMAKKLIDFATR